MNGLLKKAVAELLGVAIFVASIISATTINGHDHFANVALGATLGLMILLTASTSGGHLNPAVSLYFLAKRAISGAEFAVYVVAQLIGAALGAQLGAQLSGVALPGLGTDAASGSDLVGELIATVVLVGIVGHLAATDQGSKIPFAVGLWVVAASLYTTSGAQANPAVSFGLLFAGKSVTYVGSVVLVQVVGVLVALLLTTYITKAVAAKKGK